MIQRITTKPSNRFNAFWRETEIASKKIEGDLPAKQQKEVEIDISVPMLLKKHYGKAKTNEESQLLSELTPSFNGKYLVVSYFVRLAIRHKGWNNDSKGKIVELPIWISNPPLQMV